MGILEVYHNINRGHKEHYFRHEQSKPRPTDFTIFYFLGITYSSPIGGLATLIGSQTNELFRYYSENIFPYAPKLEFPHYLLLTLPGVLLMETLVYLWMNFYFMGMFRAQSEIALEIGMTEEETEYMQTLLSTQYHQLGNVNFHEGASQPSAIRSGVRTALSSPHTTADLRSLRSLDGIASLSSTHCRVQRSRGNELTAGIHPTLHSAVIVLPLVIILRLIDTIEE